MDRNPGFQHSTWSRQEKKCPTSAQLIGFSPRAGRCRKYSEQGEGSDHDHRRLLAFPKGSGDRCEQSEPAGSRNFVRDLIVVHLLLDAQDEIAIRCRLRLGAIGSAARETTSASGAFKAAVASFNAPDVSTDASRSITRAVLLRGDGLSRGGSCVVTRLCPALGLVASSRYLSGAAAGES